MDWEIFQTSLLALIVLVGLFQNMELRRHRVWLSQIDFTIRSNHIDLTESRSHRDEREEQLVKDVRSILVYVERL